MYLSPSQKNHFELASLIESGKLVARFYNSDQDRLTVFIPKRIDTAALCKFLTENDIEFELIPGSDFGYSETDYYDKIKIPSLDAQKSMELLDSQYP